MNLEYIAHSAFALHFDSKTILIDPFISGNPLANFDWSDYNITDILLTHGHSDHLGDAIVISKSKKATITATFELANYCARQGARVNGINLGSRIQYSWGSAWFVPARHSSSTPDGNYAGEPAGIVLNIDGTKIYHAGDTSLTSEMSLIKDIYHPQIAILPVGGHFTMGIDEAVIAAQILGAEKVIPMHYNTFPAIQTNIKNFIYKLESTNSEPIILNPGEKLEL